MDLIKQHKLVRGVSRLDYLMAKCFIYQYTSDTLQGDCWLWGMLQLHFLLWQSINIRFLN